MTKDIHQQSTEWFESWFDSPYYHILYNHRNDKEAQQFLDQLIYYVNMPEQGTVLDMACGRGRHSKYLNSLGFNVTGIDLSVKSIQDANLSANEKLVFKVHDIRNPVEGTYDLVLSLFTSFGYFENEKEDLQVLKGMKKAINTYGLGVLDFMNTDKVIRNLVPEEQVFRDGITFNIKRFVKDGFIIKEISFENNNQKFHFYEKVKALTLPDFEILFSKSGIDLLDVFGDYSLGKYQPDSDRLLFIFK
jgi:SAM-dependent methyltransferase